ncbi:lipopolysaccharide biosynthesis protein [Terrabacter sp. BE26]|uniref:lipopolysaccharide biosynthesis protein n=1 Tax=Terrabacter sp. BE26 TaxID=2898152 RepID=UPI0035BE5E83
MTSGLGFVYWAAAARLYSQRAVGLGSAAISVMMLLGTIGMAGLGTVLIAELPLRSVGRARLVAAGLLASAGVSAVLALIYVLTASRLSDALGMLVSQPGGAGLFVLGVALTGAILVFDQATLGLHLSALQLWRNTIFAIVKIGLLVALALAVHDEQGLGILASWVGGTALSMVLLGVVMRLRGMPIAPRPQWSLLRGLGRTTLAHNWLNLGVQAPRLLIPAVVTATVSASAGGAFYAAWTVVGFLFILPTHLSTALFAVASADRAALARKTRLTLRVSLAVGLCGSVGLAVGAPLILALFGRSYAREATVPLQVLVLAYVPMMVKTHYVAAARVRRRIPRAAVVMIVWAVLELAAVSWGAHVGGLVGVASWFVGAMAVEALVLAPMVWSVAAADQRKGGRT